MVDKKDDLTPEGQKPAKDDDYTVERLEAFSDDPAGVDDLGDDGIEYDDADETAADSPDGSGVEVDSATGDGLGGGSDDHDDLVPAELREERQDPATMPKTGLVSEFRDLTSSQAAYLVANRETSTVSRSPLFYVSVLIVGLAVLASLIIGVNRAGGGGGAGALAVVGVDQAQADTFGQQLGIEVISVDSMEAGEEKLRAGDVEAVYAPDLTGMGQAQLIAFDKEPTKLLEALQPPMPVTYLEKAPVHGIVADAGSWGIALIVILASLTLGAAMYDNLRTEKRNRLAEVIAATIPPRAAAWGRVYGLTALSLVFPVVAVGLLLMGLSIVQRTTLAMGLLPALGWFALLCLVSVLLALSLHLLVSTIAGKRTRRVAYGLVGLLVIAGAIAPIALHGMRDVFTVLSYTPFTAPVAMPMRYMGGTADWWEGLAAAAVVLVVGLIVFALASSRYRATLLTGAGRAGRKAKLDDSKTTSKGAEPKKAKAAASGKAGKTKSADADDD